MKFVFLAGGFSGFALVFLNGFFADRPTDLVLRDAAIACLVGAVLFRWFWSVVVNAMTETVNARRAAAEAEAEAQAASNATPVMPGATARNR